jgi:hypothetical protein
MRLVRATWTIGGAGLALSGVIGMLQYFRLGIGSVLVVTSDVVFGVTVIFLAIGLSKDASLVARRPLGAIALVLLALLPFAIRGVYPYLPELNHQTEDALTAFSFGSIVLPYVAALIGSFQIGRAGTVPTPWRWAPWWATLFSIVLLVLRIILLSAATSGTPYGAASVYLGVPDLLARTLALGTLALVLARRLRDNNIP